MSGKYRLFCSLMLSLAGLLSMPSFAAEQSDGAASEYQQALSQLNWIKGPKSVDLFNKASINIPQGFVFLSPADTQKFMTLNHNLSGQEEYLFAPDDLRWFGIFSFSGDGYIKDNEKIDDSKILESIKSNTEEGNQQRRETTLDQDGENLPAARQQAIAAGNISGLIRGQRQLVGLDHQQPKQQPHAGQGQPRGSHESWRLRRPAVLGGELVHAAIIKPERAGHKRTVPP